MAHLPGNLNRAEVGSLTAAGVPRREILPGNLNRAEIGALTAAGASRDEILPGNLNRTELDLLRESEPKTEFEILIGQLIAAGVPREEILRIIQSRMDAMTGGVEDVGGRLAAGASRSAISQLGADVGGRIAAGDPMSRFNQGGIVSLRHLTRPLGI